MKRLRFVSPVALLAALLLATGAGTGCDTSFERFDDDQSLGPYSIVGYLDPVADTQFVRVEALRDSVLAGGPLPDARVTSTHLGTGEATVWQDTLVEVGEEVFAPLFYTTAPVAPEARYRFRAQRASDGATSHAEVVTPKRLPPPRVTAVVPRVGQGMGGPDEVVVTMENTDAVGGVRVFYHYRVCRPMACYPRRRTFFHLGRVERVAEGRYRVGIPWKDDVRSTLIKNESFNGFYEFRVTVGSVSETWPDYAAPLDSMIATQPPPSAEISNVTGGTGFLGGASVRTVQVPTRLQNTPPARQNRF